MRNSLALILAAAACIPPPAEPDARARLRAAIEGRPREARLATLNRALSDPSPRLRAAAARILGMEFLLAPSEMKPLAALLDDRDFAVRAEAARALLAQIPLAPREPPPPAPTPSRVPARPTGAPAIPGRDPFAAVGAMNRENLRALTELRAAIEARARGLPGAPPAESVLRLLDRTTLGPSVPVPVGSQALPP
jgi:HEAT repeat protein